MLCEDCNKPVEIDSQICGMCWLEYNYNVSELNVSNLRLIGKKSIEQVELQIEYALKEYALKENSINGYSND